MYQLHRLLSLLLAVTLVFGSATIAVAQDSPTPTPTPAAEEEVAAEAEQTVEELLQEFTPSIEVRDQVFSVRDGILVVVPELFVTEDGWVVIHRDDAGSPGAVIGYTFVEAGPHYDVIVNLTEDLEGDTVLWAMLHIDAGEAGVYEFPGVDAPVQLNGEIVMAQFTALEPAIIVSGQSVADNTVSIEGVVTASDSWLVIHRDEDGAPGEVIGYAPAAPGVTPNVRVELADEISDGETLWAMLHYDLGVRGEFEFPGEDAPIRLPRGVVMESFAISSEVAAAEVTPTPTAAAEATQTPTAAAEMAAPATTPTPTMSDAAAPDMLPVTGASLTQESNSILPWLAVILGIMAVAGIAIFRRRMTE
ncbi:MAG: hypothetical protein KF893_07195 [Caldilineaceae bacterium]|nr:hypothetical protein [Caldilineaceae bacterium]